MMTHEVCGALTHLRQCHLELLGALERGALHLRVVQQQLDVDHVVEVGVDLHRQPVARLRRPQPLQ